MIRMLTHYFSPDKIEPGYSLAIGAAAEAAGSGSDGGGGGGGEGGAGGGGGGGGGDGGDGAGAGAVAGAAAATAATAAATSKKGPRLTHSHARQFHFVLQSLMLWRAVTHDMFRLWMLAEEDLLDQSKGNAYKLVDTGQGALHCLRCLAAAFAAAFGLVGWLVEFTDACVWCVCVCLCGMRARARVCLW